MIQQIVDPGIIHSQERQEATYQEDLQFLCKFVKLHIIRNLIVNRIHLDELISFSNLFIVFHMIDEKRLSIAKFC